MRVSRVLMVAGVSLGLLMPGTPANAECSHSERLSGSCTTVSSETDREQVTIERTESSAGTSGSRAENAGSSSQPGSSWWQPPPIRTEAELGSSECEVTVGGLCRGAAPPKTETESSAQATPPAPPTHASQLRRFRPHRPSIVIEPAGWSLPTLPTNMVAVASRHRVRGELLGWPVTVRFTPVAYHWSFGDGARASRSSTGSTWRQQGKDQFDSTATAHRYARPGNYRVELQVDYRVEFRFDGDSFEDVSGLVSATASPHSVTVFTVSPLLFGR